MPCDLYPWKPQGQLTNLIIKGINYGHTLLTFYILFSRVTTPTL